MPSMNDVQKRRVHLRPFAKKGVAGLLLHPVFPVNAYGPANA